jgi:hypothetical protein
MERVFRPAELTMSRLIPALSVLALLLHASSTAHTQGRPLSIVSATPTGEVGQIADAHEIRILFSEPMIELGAPATGRPAWLAIAPAVTANWARAR